MYERAYGSKAKETAGLSTVEIAKLVRKEIREKIKSGHFPKEMKVSVTSEYFSGGSSIDVNITSLPFNHHNPEYIRHCIEKPDEFIPALEQYTEETKQIMEELKKIGWQYNFDGSDSMIDYFDVRYYYHVGIYWEYEYKLRDEIIETTKQEIKQEQNTQVAEARDEQVDIKAIEIKEAPAIDLTNGQFIREIEAVYKSQEWVNQILGEPKSVAEFLYGKIGNRTEEHFVAIYLDVHNIVTGWTVISKGTVNESIVHPREIFKNAILTNSSSVIVAHNHPSGELRPSSEDIKTTQRIQEAGKIIGVPVLDHLIIAQKTYYSMREGGEIL